MERSLWAHYKTEMHGLTVIEEPWGFCAFCEAPDSIFIDEFYVIPEHRKSGLGRELLGRIKMFAHKSGKKLLSSTVTLNSNTANLSLLAQLSVGFRVVRAENNALLLHLSLEDGNG